MGQKYTLNFSWTLLLAIAISMNFAFAVPLRADTTYLLHLKNKNSVKSSYLKNGIKANFPTFKPITASSVTIKPAAPKQIVDDKLLTNVQVYPTTITDQINIKYTVSRNSNVTIKILDVLGNNVATLVSQRVEPGEQKFSSYLNNKLTSGFYFVRVVVGTESVIKRISIL